MGLKPVPARRVTWLAMLASASLALTIGPCAPMSSARAEPTRPAGSWPLVPAQLALPRARPETESAPQAESGADDLPHEGELPENFRELARTSGEPQIPGLTIVYLHPLGLPADAVKWRNIIVHQTEGPAGSAKSMALAQAKNPTKRGVTVWVETDGTVYWSTGENVIPTHGDGANRNDSKYIDNSKTYRSVIKTNSIGVEFVGNYPDVAKSATREQRQAWLILVRFLQERYDIPAENIYAHNWIDFKDRRYCEGCELATLARKLGYAPGRRASSSE